MIIIGLNCVEGEKPAYSSGKTFAVCLLRLRIGLGPQGPLRSRTGRSGQALRQAQDRPFGKLRTGPSASSGQALRQAQDRPGGPESPETSRRNFNSRSELPLSRFGEMVLRDVTKLVQSDLGNSPRRPAFSTPLLPNHGISGYKIDNSAEPVRAIVKPLRDMMKRASAPLASCPIGLLGALLMSI